MITVIIFSVNNLELVSHPYMNWTMGSFMCHFVPMCQSFGVILSSIALLMIAMDRYRNIVEAMNKRWNPRKVYCLLGLVVVWLICAALSVPMFIYYSNEKVLVIFLDEHGQLPVNYKKEILYMCVVTDKSRLSESFLLLLVLVFTPLFFVFFWFYFKIAQLIWRHRKPIQTEADEKSNVSVTESSVITSSDTNKNYLQNVQVKNSLNNNKNEQMKKKLRTFKVIVILVINFIVCRLPYWIFTLAKLSYPLKGQGIWRLNILIMALNVFNTILNPLFYTYLNVTMKILRRISKELTTFLCCFFSDEEFVEFERGKSIFANDKMVQIIHIQCKQKMLAEKY
ncbi:hypothetical protein WA026_010946 [Henosepilachna vigintioctopunctata]|uniref:G-protein coupled receptors family 1 profile domain-containing protein n=1 Tax=Henosepilachna vigintioctopunctata TaxID=420089 RepID=A0AAW1UWF7_9CUCU